MADTDKHTRLMNAAAACFARCGYKKTSVDEIVRAAGVSKGLFYHYYAGKKQIYLALYDAYAALLKRALREQIDLGQTDFIERLKQISRIKLGFAERYPSLWDFMAAAYYETHPDIAPAIQEKNAALVEAGYTGSAANIDWTKLRGGLSPQQAVQLVLWLADGFMLQQSREEKTLNRAACEQFDACLDLLRDGLYGRPEGGDADAVL